LDRNSEDEKEPLTKEDWKKIAGRIDHIFDKIVARLDNIELRLDKIKKRLDKSTDT